MPSDEQSVQFEDLTGGWPDAQRSEGGETAQPGREPTLAELPPTKAARRAFKLWDQQTPLLKRRILEWKVNALRRAGHANVSLVKDRDTDQFTVYLPPGSMPQTPSLNKAARLCRRLRSTLFTDPPVPEAVPSGDDDEARDRAEFSTRILQELESEAAVGNAMACSQAFDLASTYDSGFVHYRVDKTAGGLVPLQIMASKTATTVAEAMVVVDENGVPRRASRHELTRRYVMADPTGKPTLLTDDRAAAFRRWAPALRRDVLTAKHVRFLPVRARDIWEAEGAMVGVLATVGELRRAFPDAFAALTDEQLAKLVSAKPEEARDLLPPIYRPRNFDSGGEKVTESSLVFTLTVYYRQQPDYPKGFYGVFAGSTSAPLLLHRQPWVDEAAEQQPLDVPLAQFKQFDREEDGYGLGAMAILGPGNEIRAAMKGTMLEHLYRFLNRKTFVPITSTYNAKVAQAAMGTVVPVNPGGEPKTEDVPDFPAPAIQMHEDVTAEMDEDIGLAPVAQGENPPSVQSGLHAQTLIEQVNVGLSDVRQNTARALERGWRIELQLMRAYFDVPTRLSYLDEDGAYKEQVWSGADLGSTKDVRVMRGSFTMLAPSAKMAIAEMMFNTRDPATGQGLITAAQLKRIAIGNVGGLLAVQDDPHWQRIRRQVNAWKEGPPREAMADEQLMLAASARVFTPVPADEEQDIALLRHDELRRLISSVRYRRWPPAWRAGLDAEYARMKQAAGIKTIPEQLAEQQHAAAAQQQADAAAQAQAEAAAMQQQAQAQAQADEQRLVEDERRRQEAGEREAQRAAQESQGRIREQQAQLGMAKVMAQIVEAVRPEPMAPAPAPNVAVVIPRPTKVRYGDDGRVAEFVPS